MFTVCNNLACSVGRWQTKLCALWHNINVTQYILINHNYMWKQLALCNLAKLLLSAAPLHQSLACLVPLSAPLLAPAESSDAVLIPIYMNISCELCECMSKQVYWSQLTAEFLEFVPPLISSGFHLVFANCVDSAGMDTPCYGIIGVWHNCQLASKCRSSDTVYTYISDE